ncbi:MAG: Crp/Fnr family transcriptional regulator [Armatimonadota bacterium]
MEHTLTDDDLDGLGQIYIFESLDQEQLMAVAHQASALDLNRRHVIFSPESYSESTYLLLRGKVKLFQMSEEGREVTVEVLQGGDIFGQFSDNNNEDGQGMWAETMEPSKVVVLTAADFAALLQHHTSVALKLVDEMSARLSRRAGQIEDLALRNVPARIASTLIKLGEEHGIMGRDGITIDLRLTHQDIANMVAASRETGTTVLTDMRHEGIIDIERKRVRIAHPEGLQARARLE